MLVGAQFPLADLRRFYDPPGTCGRPTWPDPSDVYPSHFVRSMGGITRRPLGGVEGWVGENRICKAVRGIRYQFGLPAFHLQSGRVDVPVRGKFRRLFADGLALVKVELGLTAEPMSRRVVGKAAIREFLDYLPGLPLSLHGDPSGKISVTLSRLPNVLPKLYAQLTSTYPPSKHQPIRVLAARPLFFAERNSRFNAVMPDELKPVWLPANLHVSLYHGRLQHNGHKHEWWVLQRQAASDPKAVRLLRIYLLRLHAEQQVLRVVLDQLASGKLPLPDSEAPRAMLARYLRLAVKHIRRSTVSLTNVSEQIAEVARGVEDAIEPGRRDALLTLADNLRVSRQLRSSLEDEILLWSQDVEPRRLIVNYTKDESVKVNVVGDKNVVALVAHSQKVIQDALGEATKSGPDDVKEKLTELSNLMLRFTKEAPPEVVEQASRDFSDLAKEATTLKPRKRFLDVTAEGLLEAAKTCAALTGPITQAVKGLLALFA